MFWSNTSVSMADTTMHSCSCVSGCRCSTLNKDTVDMTARSTDGTIVTYSKDTDEVKSRPGSPKMGKVRSNVTKPTTSESDNIAGCSLFKSKPAVGGRVKEGTAFHVLQPHSHKRHYQQHMLDHFTSQDFLRKQERLPRRAVWTELAPVTTVCEYKDTNFLTQTTSEEQRRASHPQTRPTSSRGRLGRFTQESRDGIFTTGHFAADPQMELLHKGTVLNIDNIKLKNEIDQKSAKPITLVSSIYQGNTGTKTRRAADARKHDCSFYRGKPTRHKFHKSLVMNYPKFGQPLQNRGGYCQTSKTRGKNRRSIASLTEMQQMVNVTLVDVATQTYSLTENIETVKPTTDYVVPTSTGLSFELSDIQNSSFSASSTPLTSPTSSASELLADEPIFEKKEDFPECAVQQERVKPITSKQELKQRMSKNRKDMQSLRSYVFSLETHHPELKLPFLAVLNELEQVSAEGYELYDEFDDFPNEDRIEVMRLSKEVRAYKRACKVLEYQVRKFEQRPENCDDEIGRLADEVKLSRHVAVSLHYELQAAEKKLQKLLSENEDCRVKVIGAETRIEVLEKEDRRLRNAVDQLSLHASSTTTSCDVLEFDKNSIRELKIKLQFKEEEIKSVLLRLARTEKEVEKYKEHHGKCKVATATSGEGEKTEGFVQHSELKLKLNDDQATALGRRVIALELENESLGKQLRDALDRSSDTSRRPSSSDLQFLEDEVEVLRNAVHDLEDENFILKTRLVELKHQLSQKSDELEKEKSRKTSPLKEGEPSISEETLSEHTISNRDFNTSSLNIAPRYMAIDEGTQTFPPAPKSLPSPSPVKETFSESRSLVQEISYILSHTENVEEVVCELRQLALATRHLLNQSPCRQRQQPQEFQSSLKLVVADSVLQPVDISDDENEDEEIEFKVGATPTAPLIAPHQVTEFSTSPNPDFRVHDYIVTSLIVYILVTTLPILTSFKLLFLLILFFIV
uniref:protein SOGA3-like n=1 Tax=Ciona intestinalis TaxID=7719 RepID=UPI00089DA8D2|nr:protein SOGA3-like [Ciona intestinalis]|eukprot:XP_018671235.1 protein SOGA3-like [Ciona intestinalis]